MGRATRTLLSIGSILALVGVGALVVAQFAGVRWLAIPALIVWISGGAVVLVAGGWYLGGRGRAAGD